MVRQAHYDGLPKGGAQYSAIKLFLQSARRTQPSFELMDENLGDVAVTGCTNCCGSTPPKSLEVPIEGEEAVRDCHCAYYAGFLQQREAGLKAGNQKHALAEIDAEIENLRAGWNWAVDQRGKEDLDRSLESLAEFYRLRAWLQEGERTCARAAQSLAGEQSETASRPEVDRQSRIVLGRVLMQQGRFCDPLGLAEKGVELLQKSLAIVRDLGAQREMVYALWGSNGVICSILPSLLWETVNVAIGVSPTACANS